MMPSVICNYMKYMQMDNAVNKKNCKTVRRQSQQKGMTLLEVLVSMLVIGLALAMSISMIQAANRYGETAEYSAAALQRAQSVIDKMRANQVAAPAYVFGSVAGTRYDALYPSVDMNEIPAKISCKFPGATDPLIVERCQKGESVAKDDMEAWKKELADNLPGGKGIIRSINDRAGYEVIVMWSHTTESEAMAAGTSKPTVASGIRVRFSL